MADRNDNHYSQTKFDPTGTKAVKWSDEKMKMDKFLSEWSSDDSEGIEEKIVCQEILEEVLGRKEYVQTIPIEVIDEVTQEREVIEGTIEPVEEDFSDFIHDYNNDINNPIDVSTNQDNPDSLTTKNEIFGEKSQNEKNVERKNECEFCDEIFGKDECYREHLKTHLVEWKEKSTRLRRPRGAERICELCNFSTQFVQIRHHLKTYHKVSKPLQKDKECFICYLASAPVDSDFQPKLFYFNEGIRIHIQREHESEDWKYVCNICESRFVNALGLDMHKELSHDSHWIAKKNK